MKKVLLSLVIVMSLSLTFFVSCSSNPQLPSGELPILKVGDAWTWTMNLSNQHTESTYTMIQTVTGERVVNGIDCYIMSIQIASAPMMIMTEAIDKTTLAPIKGEDTYSFNGTYTFNSTTNISYDYSVKPYPLSVGKTWTVTTNLTTTELGEEQPGTWIDRYIYEVEKVENVTVPAGIFQCFKIVRYNSSNSIESIYWITDETAMIAPVKAIDNVSGATRELISYSLSK